MTQKKLNHLMLRKVAWRIAQTAFWVVTIFSIGEIGLRMIVAMQAPDWEAYMVWTITIAAVFVLTVSTVFLMPLWLAKQQALMNSRDKSGSN